MTKAYSNKALPSGTILREWRLEEVLGVGGFGIVYKGRGIYFNELVAIKEYFPSSISERDEEDTVVPIDSDAEEVHALGLKKFVEEAKLLWNLSTPTRHPNIVNVRSLFEIHGTAYMVMDFEDGVSLSKMLKNNVRFNERSLHDLIRPIAEGLDRAHRVGVLHRDIKPPNILVNEDGRPVLIDFGSARFEAAEATSTKVTFHTPPYAAIEQYVKTYDQGPWTDIYALGVVLYECVTGAKPPEVLERLHGGLGKALADGKYPGYSKRFLAAIDAAMTIKPSKPRRSPQQTDLNMVELLLDTRRRLAEDGWDNGPISVLDELRRKGVSGLPSRATVARIFLARGVVKPQPRKRPRSSYRRFVNPQPNGCWQLDALEWRLADGTIIVIFQLTDDHSRLNVASLAAPGETSDAAVEVFQRGIKAWGVPQRLLSDNGVALNPTRRGRTSPLVELAWSLGVTTMTGKPYKPTTQGKNERGHQTLQRYLRARPASATIQELQALVDDYDRRYNTERGHQALPGRITPLQAWNATPVAPAPVPPKTLPQLPLRLPHRPRARPVAPPMPLPPMQRRTDPSGAVAAAGSRYAIGIEHAGQTIHVLVHTETIDFFDQNGTHLATHARALPGTYVGSGLPTTRRPRRPSTTS